MGWMREVSENARPLLERLSRAEWWNLSYVERRFLAAWATMFTTTYEFANRTTMAATADQRQYLMEHREPPPGWWVWVGRYAYGGFHSDGAWHRGYGLPYAEQTNQTEFNVLFNTFNFGKLLLHVHGRTAPLNFNGSAYGERLLLQPIWPSFPTIIRPPAFVHTDVEYERLAQAFVEIGNDYMTPASTV